MQNILGLLVCLLIVFFDILVVVDNICEILREYC